MKGEEAEQLFNKLAESSLKIVMDDTRETERSTGQADKKHTSGSVCIATDRWSLVVGGQHGEGSSENGSRQRRKNCTSMAHCQRRAAGACNLLLAFRRTVAAQRSMKAVIMRTRRTPYPWLVACDANMEPEVFAQSSCFNEKYKTIKTTRGGSTCRNLARSCVGRKNERPCHSLHKLGNQSGGHGRRPHKPAVFEVMLGQEQKISQRARCRELYQEAVVNNFQVARTLPRNS